MATFSDPYWATIDEPPSTKKTFRMEATTKQRNPPRIKSIVRSASIAGRTIDVTIIDCCANLVNEISGRKAHRTLAPANARYARRQMMFGGNASLPRRERLCTAITIEIAAKMGQKIRLSIRGSTPLCNEPEAGKIK